MNITQTEMPLLTSGLAAPEPAFVRIPRADEELGPLGDAYVVAIWAGQSEQVSHVGAMNEVFGPTPEAAQGGQAGGHTGLQVVARADGQPNIPLDYGAVARGAHYLAHGGVGGRARFCGIWNVGGQARDNKGKLSNWAAFCAVGMVSLQFAAFTLVSYRDVVRTSG